MNFIEELKWRGILQDMIPGTEEQLQKEMTVGYVGFDPTADSLGVGNLAAIMLLKHFQRCGHKPLALVGGATGMVGDPSGKSAERKFLDEAALKHNLACQKKQLEKFLDFNCGANSAEIVNNYDWFKNFGLLEFLRDVGKHITVNYMLAKDSVKNRLEGGISFTEFSYQLIQGYDFYYLNEKYNCKLQMGGSDQWGNITTGTELVRRKSDREAFALTGKLITKSDGTKFGKSEGGNIWLDAKKTSPYQFYQFWLNVSDDDALRYIKIFTTQTQAEVEALAEDHAKEPGFRALQKALAKAVTITVHSEEAFNEVVEASSFLFNKECINTIKTLTANDVLNKLKVVHTVQLDRAQLGTSLIDVLAEKELYSSKGEARKAIKNQAVSINKIKATEAKILSAEDLLHDKMMIVQTGKTDYHVVVVS